MSNYILLKDGKVKITDVITDCHLNLCVDTKIGESLPSILRKLCAKIQTASENKTYLTNGEGISISGNGTLASPYNISATLTSLDWGLITNKPNLDANNGLNKDSGPFQLGGTLLKSTSIDINNYDLSIGTPTKNLKFTNNKVELNHNLSIESTGALTMVGNAEAALVHPHATFYADDGGQLPAGTYYFMVYAYNSLGQATKGEMASITIDGIVGSEDEADCNWNTLADAVKYRVYASLDSSFTNAKYREYVVGTPLGDYHVDFMGSNYFYLYKFNTPDDGLISGPLPAEANTWIPRNMNISANSRYIDKLCIGVDKMPSGKLHIIKDSPDEYIWLEGEAPSLRIVDAIPSNNLNILWGGVTANDNYIQGSVPGDQVMINNKGNFIISANAIARDYPVDFKISTLGNTIIGSNTDNSRAKLQVNGTIQSTTLQGVGDRPVAVDANGVFKVGATPANNGNYIYNTTIQQASANFNIDGAGTIGTILTTKNLTTTGSVTASSALARGVYMNNTLVAAANNDVLVGLEINPTFNNGAYIGVTNTTLKVTGTSLFENTGTNAKLISGTVGSGGKILYVNNGKFHITYDGSTMFSLSAVNSNLRVTGNSGKLILGTEASQDVEFIQNGATVGKITTGGKLLWGGITDQGVYNLQIQGDSFFNGNLQLKGTGSPVITDRTDGNLNGLKFNNWQLTVKGTNQLDLQVHNGPMVFSTGTTGPVERMRIDASGNVSITNLNNASDGIDYMVGVNNGTFKRLPMPATYGAADFIQNQNTSAQTANAWINGTFLSDKLGVGVSSLISNYPIDLYTAANARITTPSTQVIIGGVGMSISAIGTTTTTTQLGINGDIITIPFKSTNNGPVTYGTIGASGGNGFYMDAGASSTLYLNHGGNRVVSIGSSKAVNIIYNHAPTSGNTQYNALNVVPTINQTGTANGIVVGIRYVPTLTAITGAHWGLWIDSGKTYLGGNVGIGGISPTYTLDVNGTGRISSKLFLGSITDQGTYSLQVGGSVYIGGSTATGMLVGVTASHQLTASANNQTLAGLDILPTFTTTGYTGVTTYAARFGNGTTNFFGINSNGSSANFVAAGTISSSIGTGGLSGRFYIDAVSKIILRTGGIGGSATERFFIDGSGNVTISNVEQSTYKLYVNGVTAAQGFNSIGDGGQQNKTIVTWDLANPVVISKTYYATMGHFVVRHNKQNSIGAANTDAMVVYDVNGIGGTGSNAISSGKALKINFATTDSSGWFGSKLQTYGGYIVVDNKADNTNAATTGASEIYGLYIDAKHTATTTTVNPYVYALYTEGGDIRFGNLNNANDNIDYLVGANNGVLKRKNAVKAYTPTSSTDTTGDTGDITYDDTYMYIKTVTGWKRSTLTTF